MLLIRAPGGGNRKTMNPEYQRLVGPSAELWPIGDAMHVEGIHRHREEYERRVVGFLDRALAPGGTGTPSAWRG